MKTQIHRASLEAQSQVVSLRAFDGLKGVQVDREAGVIRNCAVMTIGAAKGHGWAIDRTTIEQLQSLLSQNTDGTSVRFKHPPLDDSGRPEDSLGTDVGKLKNTRIEGDSVRGDIYLADYAKNLPIYGDVSTYLLSKAGTDPTGIGLSAEIYFTLQPSNGTKNAPPVARIVRCDAVDFVGKAAANPNGLLSEPIQPTNPPVSAGGIDSQPTNPGDLNMEPTIPAAVAAPVSQPVAPVVQQATLNEGVTAAISHLTPTAAPAPAPQTAVQTPNLIEAEKVRCTQLRDLAGIYPGIPAEVVNAQIAANSNLEQARQAFLQFIAEKNPPVKEVATGTVVVGADAAIVAHLAAIPDAIMIRAGQKVEKPHALSDKLRCRKMSDMFKTLMTHLGVAHDEVMDISPTRMAELITNPLILSRAYPEMYARLAQSSSSFSNLLTDAMGKTLRKAYMDTPTTWQLWCGRDVAPDFKSKKFIQLSDAPGLTAKTEGKEIVYSTFSDSKETATLVTYASGIKLTREAIINDDLNAFGRIPMAQGGAAKRLEDDVAYAILTANAALADTVALFHGTHSNLVSVTAGLGAPTVTTVAAAEKLMLLQTGPKGAYLKLQARSVLVPVALKTVTQKLLQSPVDPAGTNAAINPYYNQYQVIAEPRLDANSSVIWYLAADPGVIDTVTMVFLTDEPEPVLKQDLVFDTEDAKFAVRHTVVAKAVDYRGLVKNPGA